MAELAPRPARIPEVRLGQTVSNGIAPSMFALLDRGVRQRPDLAVQLRGTVVIRFKEHISPVRISFGSRVVRVEDGDMRRPSLAVSGSLPHVVQLTITPMMRGSIPDLRNARGRAALLRLAFGRVRLRGDMGLALRMLEMMAVPPPDGAHHRRQSRPVRTRQAEPAWIDVLT